MNEWKSEQRTPNQTAAVETENTFINRPRLAGMDWVDREIIFYWLDLWHTHVVQNARCGSWHVITTKEKGGEKEEGGGSSEREQGGEGEGEALVP